MEAEIDLLIAMLDATIAASCPRTAIVVANGDIGTSFSSELVARACALHPSLRTIVARADPARAGTPFDLIGRVIAKLGNQELREERLDWAWDELLRASASEAPLLVVLDDLHCADVASVRLIDVAMSGLEDRPILSVALGRPELQSRFPTLWARRGVHRIFLRS